MGKRVTGRAGALLQIKGQLKAIERELRGGLGHNQVRDPPASESFYWRPKSERPQEDADWINDGGWSGKR